MGCSDGCYCGCDTRANRIKFIVFGVLFVLGWVCIFAISGITSRANCVDIPEDCKDRVFSDDDPANAPQTPFCDQIRQERDDCVAGILPSVTFFSFVWLMSWIGCSIPLCMMCCCTKDPHEATFPGAPIQMYEMPQVPVPVGAYAPTQPNINNPFMQAAQEPAFPQDDGGVISKPVEVSADLGIPVYTAQITTGVRPSPDRQGHQGKKGQAEEPVHEDL